MDDGDRQHALTYIEAIKQFAASMLLYSGYRHYVQAGGWHDTGRVDDDGNPIYERLPDRSYYTRLNIGAPPVRLMRHGLAITLPALRADNGTRVFAAQFISAFMGADAYEPLEGVYHDGAIELTWLSGMCDPNR